MACVVPMPNIESVGEQVNLPPYALPNFVRPAPEQLIDFDPQEDTSVELNTGPIGDPNPTDRLHWRWFLDYREATFNRPIEFSEASGALPSDLVEGISKTIRPCSEPTYSLLRMIRSIASSSWWPTARSARRSPMTRNRTKHCPSSNSFVLFGLSDSTGVNAHEGSHRYKLARCRIMSRMFV